MKRSARLRRRFGCSLQQVLRRRRIRWFKPPRDGMRTAIEINLAKIRIGPSYKGWAGINVYRTAQQPLYVTLSHTAFRLSPVDFGRGYLRG